AFPCQALSSRRGALRHIWRCEARPAVPGPRLLPKPAESLARRGGRIRIAELVGDEDQLVRISALVATGTHRRGDRPDLDGSILAHVPGEIAQAVWRRVQRRGYPSTSYR